MTEVTHKTIISSLSSEERKALIKRSDFAGLKQTWCHFGLLFLSSLYLYSRLPFWPLLLPIQGILIVFLFTTLHETIHGTAFKTPWINIVIANLCGFIVFVPTAWFRQFHFAHHRYTNQAGLDPELAKPKPKTQFEYLMYLSGIPVAISLCKTLINNALNKNNDAFITQNHRSNITLESRVYLVIYILLGLISVFFNSTALVWLWLVPITLGQPFLRVYLLAEHTLCPEVNNMLLNSRTTLTTTFIRFIAWNMPYHAEHHTLPSVPFYKLPEFHQHLKDHLGTVDNGYIDFHREMINQTKPT